MSEDESTGALRVQRASEHELAETFVDLADTLVDDFDVVDLLDRLVAACVSLLPVTAAGLLLDDQRGNLAVVAASTEATRLLEVFQLQNDQGPCLDCIRTGQSVTSPDLAAEKLWPLFVPAALAAGYRAVTAVPLRLREARIGGLHLFSDRTGELNGSDHRLAQALADVATIGILQQRSAHRSSMVAEQLQHALNSRIVIEQAKGVLAERHGIDVDRAFDSLRRHARNNQLKLTDAALGVVTGELDPASVTGV